MANIGKLRITQLAEQVKDTSRPPFSACCLLESWWADQPKLTYGSGIIFGRRTVITCAHNLWRRDARMWPTRVRVTPGANGNLSPFGSVEVGPRSVEVHPVWYNAEYDYDADVHDLGVIWVPDALGTKTGWSDLTWMTDWAAQPGQELVSCGYPMDKPRQLWMQYGVLKGFLAGLFYFKAPYGGGLSGAPIWLKANKPPFVNSIALHKGEGIFEGEHMAVGFRLTPEDHIYIRQWMEQSGPNLRRISARETAPAESVSQKPARAANPPGPTKLKTKAVKTTGGATKRGAAAANKGSLTAGVEVLLAPGKTASWKFPIQAGQTADFTFLAQATDPEAGLELCSLSVSDEEGARVGRVEQFVNTSGDEFNKQTLSIDAEEAGTYTATVHSQAEAELRIKLKTKFS